MGIKNIWYLRVYLYWGSCMSQAQCSWAHPTHTFQTWKCPGEVASGLPLVAALKYTEDGGLKRGRWGGLQKKYLL